MRPVPLSRSPGGASTSRSSTSPTTPWPGAPASAWRTGAPATLPVPGITYADLPGFTWDPDYVLTTAPDGKREFEPDPAQPGDRTARTGAPPLSFVTTDLKGNLDNVSGYDDPEGFGAGPYVRVNEGVNSYGTLENFADREWKVSVWGLLPWQLRGGAFLDLPIR